jgi:hypothetical protein
MLVGHAVARPLESAGGSRRGSTLEQGHLMNKPLLSTCVLGAVVSALVLSGCGGGDAPASDPSTSVIASAARNLEQRDDERDDRDDGPDDGDDRDDSEQGCRTRFMEVFDALRAAPALAPLFDTYRVPNPVEYDDDARGLVSLLRAVRISLRDGVVTITNRQTGGVIFSGRLDALADGTFYPEQLPGGTGAPPPPPQTCAFDYSEWSVCEPEGTQTRTVEASSPDGCTGTPVTSRSCTYSPPATTCSSFSYSAWSACQPDSTQTRTVTGSSPAGCTGGSPVTSQACTYTPPACTYTYSAWSACSASATQTRTVASSSPAGCAGTPVLTQSCTPPTQSCTTCHGIPPSTGKHTFHASRTSCSSCHGTGYSTTTAIAATHMNGVKDLASGAGWNATSRSCANSCHGSKSW